jgi:hypothetical protein
MKEMKKLFHHNGTEFRWLEDWLIAHEERSHELEYRNLKRKVERSNDCNRTIRPAGPD